MDYLEKITALRRLLHGHPEASEKEIVTRGLIKDFLEKNTENLEIVDKGKWLYGYHNEGAQKTYLFRADFDAILREDGQCYHGCGHDGHTAILAGLAMKLDKEKLGRNIIYLFQHAEENAAGAIQCREIFDEKKVDYAFALHGHVGMPLGRAGVHEDVVCCASQGMLIHLKGVQSHASSPELGINPAYLMAELALFLKPLSEFKGFVPMSWEGQDYENMIMATIVYQRLGEKAFGVSPSTGEMGLTLRAYNENEMFLLQERVENFVKERAEKEGLEYSFTYLDIFPETRNNADLAKKVKLLWEKEGLDFIEKHDPHRGSEDFGHLAKEVPSCYFELGLGSDSPPLHNIGFQFLDEASPYGLALLEAIARKGID